MTSGGKENKLQEVDSEKDLGVVLDKKLVFDQHIQDKVRKYDHTLGII